MIIDNLDSISLYQGISPGFAKAVKFILANDLNALPEGVCEIDGRNLYYIPNRSITEPAQSKRWEAHRRYGDIQCVLSGRQKVGYAHIGELCMTDQGYDEEKDIAFFTPRENRELHHLILGTGQFIVFFPQDAHKPMCAVDVPEQIHMFVVKFLV